MTNSRKIIANGINEKKQSKLFPALDMYAEGKTFNEISTTLRLNKSQISYDFHKVEALIAPKTFIRNRANNGPSMKDLVEKVTQKQRRVGAHAASIYDFHALRTTFVTIARSAGMNLEDIRTITGHTDTKMLEQYYDRTKGIAIAQRFTKAAPEFFSATAPKTTITNDSHELMPANKADMAERIKALSPAERKKLLRQAMLVQQLLIDSDDE